MPEMTLLGWFHTVLGVLAVLSGFYTLYKFRVISLKEGSGKVYVLVTFVVAASALGIYNQGGFGIAHMLAVLTLIALVGGVIMEKNQSFWCLLKIFSSTWLYKHTFVSHDSCNK